MTNNQKNKLAMIKAVLAFLVKYSAIVALLPALVRAVARLQQTADAIDARAVQKDNSVAGTLDARDDAEETLIGILDEVVSAIAAYASENKLPEVFAIVSVKRSKLEAMPNVELIQKANAINALAVQYAQAIAEYGADAEKVAALAPALAAFSTTVGNVSTGYGVRSGAVSSLKSLFQDADTELKERMDEMVNNIKDQEPQFFVGYRTARVIHDMGGSRGGSGTGGDINPPQPTPPAGGTPK